jgi:hypothetical protein
MLLRSVEPALEAYLKQRMECPRINEADYVAQWCNNLYAIDFLQHCLRTRHPGITVQQYALEAMKARALRVRSNAADAVACLTMFKDCARKAGSHMSVTDKISALLTLFATNNQLHGRVNERPPHTYMHYTHTYTERGTQLAITSQYGGPRLLQWHERIVGESDEQRFEVMLTHAEHEAQKWDKGLSVDMQAWQSRVDETRGVRTQSRQPQQPAGQQQQPQREKAQGARGGGGAGGGGGGGKGANAPGAGGEKGASASGSGGGGKGQGRNSKPAKSRGGNPSRKRKFEEVESWDTPCPTDEEVRQRYTARTCLFCGTAGHRVHECDVFHRHKAEAERRDAQNWRVPMGLMSQAAGAEAQPPPAPSGQGGRGGGREAGRNGGRGGRSGGRQGGRQGQEN